MTDRDLVLEAMAAYARAVDDRDLEALRTVFDQETVWISNRGTFRGVDAVAGALLETAGSPQTRPRHIVCNQAIRIDGDEASAVSDWYLVQPGPTWQITMAGRYHDRLRRKRGRWFFAERDIRHLATPGA